MNKKKGKEIVHEIKSISDNLKAEVIVAGLLNNGVLPQNIQIENISTFTRPYSKDIVGAAVVESSKKNFNLKLQLSRNGIYDLLPEALSHSQNTESSPHDGNHLTLGYKKRKREEAAARKFFKPFDQEFFFQCVKLEQEEQELLYNPSETFHKFLADFWGISGLLKPTYEDFFLHVLPYMATIAGDFDKIQLCLQKILEVPVVYRIDQRTEYVSSDCNKLGRGTLGRSFTVGSCIYAVPHVEFTFGPVAESEVEGYLAGGEVEKLVRHFFYYTIPVEAEAVIKILVDTKEKEREHFSFGILGYSTQL